MTFRADVNAKFRVPEEAEGRLEGCIKVGLQSSVKKHFVYFIVSVMASCNCAPERDGTPKPAPQTSEKTARSGAVEVNLVRRGIHAMGTVFEGTLAVSGDAAGGAATLDEALTEVSRVEALMTTWRKESPLSRVNAKSGGLGVSVPEELLALIEQSKAISEQTKGKFDISFGAIGRLWNFKEASPKPPDPAALEKVLNLVDYKSIIVDREKRTVRLAKKGMRIGLGAIAKGYAVDRAAAVLKSKGFNDFIIYGGGDLVVSGKKGDRPWRVGIQDPRNRSRYFAKFSLEKGGAVVTSGDYEKYFELDGKRYHHIIDPKTGYPASGTVSVTVVSDSAARADALATGIFVLGPKKGMALIEADDAIEGVIVDDGLNTTISSGLKHGIKLEPLTAANKKEAK